MYCPRCSQEQLNENLKFCPGCGLPLDVVFELVKTGQNPDLAADAGHSRSFLTRRNGILFSIVWFFAFIFFLLPLMLTFGIPEELFVAVGVLGLFGSAIIAIVSLFLKKGGDISAAINEDLGYMPAHSGRPKNNKGVLNPQTDRPAAESFGNPDHVNRFETDEMVPIRSVVEGTTKLL